MSDHLLLSQAFAWRFTRGPGEVEKQMGPVIILQAQTAGCCTDIVKNDSPSHSQLGALTWGFMFDAVNGGIAFGNHPSFPDDSHGNTQL